LTGGYIKAGYHEVIYTNKTHEAYQNAIKNKKIPWRVSSTLFGHIRYDVKLTPIGKFATTEALKEYGSPTAHAQVLDELRAISLVQ